MLFLFSSISYLAISINLSGTELFSVPLEIAISRLRIRICLSTETANNKQLAQVLITS